MQFPSAAQYPAPGVEPPIITSCMSYAAQPCDSSALTHLGDITFDATRPTLTITKVSEQYGDPTASTTRRKLQQTPSSLPLNALLLFNFSKAGVLHIPAHAQGPHNYIIFAQSITWALSLPVLHASNTSCEAESDIACPWRVVVTLKSRE